MNNKNFEEEFDKIISEIIFLNDLMKNNMDSKFICKFWGIFYNYRWNSKVRNQCFYRPNGWFTTGKFYLINGVYINWRFNKYNWLFNLTNRWFIFKRNILKWIMIRMSFCENCR